MVSTSYGGPASDTRLVRLPFQFVGEVLQLFAAGHHLDERLQRQIGLCEVTEHLPAAKDHEVIADRVRVMRVVTDEDHADSPLLRLDDVAEHDARLLDPE